MKDQRGQRRGPWYQYCVSTLLGNCCTLRCPLTRMSGTMNILLQSLPLSNLALTHRGVHSDHRHWRGMTTPVAASKVIHSLCPRASQA